MLVFCWIFLVWSAGWCTLSLSHRVWGTALPDLGVAAGRVLAITLFTLVVFLCGGLGVPVGTAAFVAFPLLIIGALSTWKKRRILFPQIRAARSAIILSELLFFGAFLFFLSVRGFWPDAADGEKPMDMALISTLYRADHLPPANAYLAGQRLTSYYYFGHLETACLTHLVGSAPRWTYNLMCATLPALILSSLCSLCAAITGRLRYGLGACLLVAVCGTVEPLRQWFPGLFGQPLDAIPYFSTSRVIPHSINEYPFFTFCFGDLHAHFFAMPLVVLIMSLAYTWRQREEDLLLLAVSAASLAALLMTNTWDFPLYTLLMCLCIARRSKPGLSLALCLTLVLLSLLISFLFWAQLKSGVSAFNWVWPLDMQVGSWLLLWGPWLAMLLAGILLWPHRERSFQNRLALCGFIALIWSQVTWSGFLPEPYERQDTIFKFGLQAWFFIGVAAASGLFPDVKNTPIYKGERKRYLPLLAVLPLFFLIPALASSRLVLLARAGHFSGWEGWDAWAYLAPPERQAAQWLSQHEREGDSLLEAEKKVGGDYSEFWRYTHATGIPAVIGPPGHSFQWNGNWDEVYKRKGEVHAFFTSGDPTLRRAILAKYPVRWIVLGELERQVYGEHHIAEIAKEFPVAVRFGDESDPHRVVICKNP